MLMWLSQRRLRQPQSALRRLLALLLVVLLYSSTSDAFFQNSEVAALDTSVIQGRPMRIVLAGPTGTGKTLFCEFLRLSLRSSSMVDPAQANAEFLRSYHLAFSQHTAFLSDTQKVTKYTETLSSGASVEIYDTPGLQDTSGPAHDIERLAEIDRELELLDYVDAVLFFFHGDDQNRSDDGMKKVLALLSTVFQPAVYPNIVLMFSHLTYSPRLPSMMIDPYLEAEFGFTSEEVKSRRFCMNNPLDSLAPLFDPSAVRETIGSILHRGKRIHRQRYNDGVKELNRLLQYFSPSRGVSRCTNPDFGSFSLNKQLFEHLGRFLAQGENTLDQELASNKAHLDAKISFQGRKILDHSLQASYNVQSWLRMASGGFTAKLGMVLGGVHYGVSFCMAVYDVFSSNDDQSLLKEMRTQFQVINEKLDSLARQVQDVVHEEMKQAVFLQIKVRSGNILKLADQLITSRTGSDSDSFFDALVEECSKLDGRNSLQIIRAYHVPDSEQYSMLRRTNYDPCKIEDVHRVLALLLENLLRAAEIARTVSGLSRTGAGWRSQLIKRMFRQAYPTADHEYMINETNAILNEFQANIKPKLHKNALNCALPEAMRYALQKHSEISKNEEALHKLVADWYRPLYLEDKLEFFVAVYRKAENARFCSSPRPHKQYSFTEPDKQFQGRPCAVKLEDVDGKCAIVMWNTCAPKFTAKAFRDCLEVDILTSCTEDIWDARLKHSKYSFAGKEYCSFQLVHSEYDWHGRSTCPARFVCETIALTNAAKQVGFFGESYVEEKFDLVIG